MSKNIVAATRLNPNSLAKARDGLIIIGYPKNQLMSTSAILRTAFLYGLTNLENVININMTPSDESMKIILKPKRLVGEKLTNRPGKRNEALAPNEP